MIVHIEREQATSTHRQILQGIQHDLGKLLREPASAERRRPFELLTVLHEIKRRAQAEENRAPDASNDGGHHSLTVNTEAPSVGQFQVSEMIGDRWTWWQKLFVATVPARSRILALDIPTVVTGPRGCGKTMLFRRLSERLIVECGEVPELPASASFIALYVNANDFADAFARFPEQPTADDDARLICYTNLCILGEFLTVQSARVGKKGESTTDEFLELVERWLASDGPAPLVVGEDRLERYRAALEQLKWAFHARVDLSLFPGFPELCQHRWLPHFIREARRSCPWIRGRTVLLFVDDFSTPRVTASMQRTLNRVFLQRSPDFLAKVATEAWTTFVPEDSSGKHLEDGDDYQLIDMGEESLFLPDAERLEFLNQVFARRLSADNRIPQGQASLRAVLGRLGVRKTEFARRLRRSLRSTPRSDMPKVEGTSQRRGASRARVQYFGEEVFANLWSGDTRTMIQLITDVLDPSTSPSRGAAPDRLATLPIDPAIQDRAFRNRGGEWLHSHTRNEPTDPRRMQAELEKIQATNPGYVLCGEYGDHLKAVVEAFVAAATALLLGPTYKITEGTRPREVPRMAFRLEIIDEFRIDGLAQEIYRDLIRYGLFMRDNRGKSVRGAFVPRLYLRRLLLPYCTLALSKRDSVPLRCADFRRLLLEPDKFKTSVERKRTVEGQGLIQFGDVPSPDEPDESYNDLKDEC